jgi:hypothetical protein
MEGETKSSREPVSARTPVFRNIAVSRMTINRAHKAIEVEGLPEMPISGLRISDVIASAEQGLTADHTRGLQLIDLQLDATSGTPYRVRDSQDLELDGVCARPVSKATPIIRLERCQNAIIRNSRAFPGTGTFLSVAPGELKDVALKGNVLDHAQQVAVEASTDSR